MPVLASTSCCDGCELASTGDGVRASIRLHITGRGLFILAPTSSDPDLGRDSGRNVVGPAVDPPRQTRRRNAESALRVASMMGSLGSPPVAFLIYGPRPGASHVGTKQQFQGAS